MPHGKEGQNSGCVLPCHLFSQFFFHLCRFFQKTYVISFLHTKSRKIYIVLCHQFSAVFSCDAPAEPRTSVSSIKGPPPQKENFNFPSRRPQNWCKKTWKTWKPRHLPAQYVVSQVPFSLAPPPPQTVSLSLFISFLWVFFFWEMFPFKDQPGNQQTSVVHPTSLSTFTGQRWWWLCPLRGSFSFADSS